MTLLALSESTITLLVIAGIAAVVLMWGIGIYNQLVTLSQRFKNGFAQIDVQLKRRYDLIPNIVETAKGAMAHERETLEAVISARNRAASAASTAAANPGDAAAIGSLGAAESALTQSLGRFFALAEAYPDLKANQNLLAVQEELTSTENKVAFARQAFNDSVTAYNTYRSTFPPVLRRCLSSTTPSRSKRPRRCRSDDTTAARGSHVACRKPVSPPRGRRSGHDSPCTSVRRNGFLRTPGPGSSQHQVARGPDGGGVCRHGCACLHAGDRRCARRSA
jgi:LemA protein